MSIFEKITGDLGDKRRYRQIKARAKALPEPHRASHAALERYLVHLGAGGDGAMLITMLDDLATLFEQAAADGTSVRDLVGDDPVDFAETFLANYPQGSWISKERARLGRSIATALGETSER